MRYIMLGMLALVSISQVKAESVVCNANKLQLFPKVISGPGNGAYILFADNRASSGAWEVYLQKVNSSLARQWGSDNQGIRISRTLNDSSDASPPYWHGHRLSGEMVSSMVGSDTGVIGIWINHHNLKPETTDNRIVYNYPAGIYARRISSTGAVQWDSTIYISPATSAFSVYSDGDGGCVIAWMERDGNYDYKVKVTKLTSNGGVAPGYWPVTIDEIDNAQKLPDSILGNPKVAKAGDSGRNFNSERHKNSLVAFIRTMGSSSLLTKGNNSLNLTKEKS